MGVQGETSLQRRIQTYIRSRGGYVHKNWGNMTSAPGIADLTVCYKGIYLALEIKEGNNTPSAEQGIHCRAVQKAGGKTAVVWTMNEVSTLLDLLDEYAAGEIRDGFFDAEFKAAGLDDGTRW